MVKKLVLIHKTKGQKVFFLKLILPYLAQFYQVCATMFLQSIHPFTKDLFSPKENEKQDDLHGQKTTDVFFLLGFIQRHIN